MHTDRMDTAEDQDEISVDGGQLSAEPAAEPDAPPGNGQSDWRQEWLDGPAVRAAGRAFELGASLTQFFWQAPQSRTFDAAGQTIHYHDVGEGPPVVLLHGLSVPAEMSWFASGIAQRLAGSYRVITPDLRGHGKSASPHTPEAYGMELVHDVPRLLDHLGIEKAYIAGYSLGGLITLKTMVTYPERVCGAVVCAAGWRESEESLEQTLEEMAQALESGGPCDPLRDALTADELDVATIFSGFVVKVIDWWNDPKALAALLRSVPQLLTHRDDLLQCQVPSLGICGTTDAMLTDAERLAGLKPNHRLTLLDGDSHFTSLLNEALGGNILSFLDEQEGREPDAQEGQGNSQLEA